MLEILHIAGFLLVFGTVLIVDLRLLALVLRRDPGWQVWGDLLRWAWPGFGVQLMTGPLLFIANSRKFYDNPFFRWKLVLLVLAVGFQYTFVRRVCTSVDACAAPRQTKVAGGTSLAVWAAMILAGFSIELF